MRMIRNIIDTIREYFKSSAIVDRLHLMSAPRLGAVVAVTILLPLALALAMRPGNDDGPEAAVILDEGLPALPGEEDSLARKNKLLRKKLDAYRPGGTYIIVDTASNRLYLYRGGAVVHQAIISSGSGNILEEPGGERRWIFDTPRGEYAVNSKLRDPDWVKPDWAFIEEVEEIPTRQSDRVVSGVLGDYALGFGNGYFIHGTLYTRLLGRNITHGCIRASNEDLKVIFANAAIGTKIYIF